MATPYLQILHEEVPSTQEIARARFDALPIAVIASSQTAGRGRSGATWETAPRALAVSLAFRRSGGDLRPFSLMAGVAACRATEQPCLLKWPNDVLLDDQKTGGILVEESDDVVVVGLGMNLWWPDPPDVVGALFGVDPGQARHVEIGALWAAEMMSLLDGDGWAEDEYRDLCSTIGREITWEPDGSGVAIEVSAAGELIVEGLEGRQVIRSGAVWHVRA